MAEPVTIDPDLIRRVDNGETSLVVIFEGQPYQGLGTGSYRRKDGREIVVHNWATRCRDCRATFLTFTTPKKFSPNRRCETCREAKP